MKKKMRRRLGLVCAMVMILTSVVGASAEEVDTTVDDNNVVVLAAAGGENDTMADNIVWKYKTINGKTYKRRWNNTKQVWVDPSWILVG
ncbi:MAG: hypothetical protein IKB73_00720 [Ruminococcus sp.]|nr:hypothetical protein [Ruminococcus sp.]